MWHESRHMILDAFPIPPLRFFKQKKVFDLRNIFPISDPKNGRSEGNKLIDKEVFRIWNRFTLTFTGSATLLKLNAFGISRAYSAFGSRITFS